MRAKKHIVVVMGGMSAEYDISMLSGKNVLAHIDTDQFKVSSIEITRHGEWIFSDSPDELRNIGDAIANLQLIHPDCIFIALHGPYGEDGKIQGLFDLLGVPYTGSGCASSSLSMDKIRSKAVAEHGGIKVAAQELFNYDDWKHDRKNLYQRIEENIGFPCVIKNPWQGSSLGMAIPQSVDELDDAIKEVIGFGYQAMVEKYISGREVTCGIAHLDENKPPEVLFVTEIKPVKAKFFDYDAKYTPNATDEITPADLPDDVTAEIRDISVRAHTLMGCRGFSRSDMIVSDDGIIWLEINTIPGMTETSLIPRGAEAMGHSFADLVTQLIESVLI
jgi:D-alanine-D-alanine ligase